MSLLVRFDEDRAIYNYVEVKESQERWSSIVRKVLKWLSILIACIGCIFFLGEKWGQHMAVRSFVYLD